MAQAIVFFGLHDLPLFGCIAAKPARIIVAHGNICSPMHHPARQFACQTRAPADTNLCAAAAPIVAHAGRGPNQRVAVRRVANGAVNFALDPQVCKDWHAVHAFFEIGHDTVVIGIK